LWHPFLLYRHLEHPKDFVIFKSIDCFEFCGRLSLSLSLSLPRLSLSSRRSSFKIALRFQSTARDTFFVLASLFRGSRARRTRWVLLFSRVFCSRSNFLCRKPKEGQLKSEMQERVSLLFWWYNIIIIIIIYNSTSTRAFLLSPSGGIHGGVVQRATHHGFVVSVIHANSFAAATIPKSSASVATGGD